MASVKVSVHEDAFFCDSGICPIYIFFGEDETDDICPHCGEEGTSVKESD